MAVTDAELLKKMEVQRTKALKALGGYKFWMFGYHAANWVNLNKLLTKKQANPFQRLVQAAHFMMTDAGEAQDRNIWGESAKYPVEDWAREAEHNETRLGYWNWVACQADMHGGADLELKPGADQELCECGRPTHLCKSIEGGTEHDDRG